MAFHFLVPQGPAPNFAEIKAASDNAECQDDAASGLVDQPVCDGVVNCFGAIQGAGAISVGKNEPCKISLDNAENKNHLIKIDRRNAKCEIYDKLWGRENSPYDYTIPVGSFIPRKLPGTIIHTPDEIFLLPYEPRWFECKLSMMPTLVYYFRKREQCTILTKNGRNDAQNKNCIKKVMNYLRLFTLWRFIILYHI